MLVWKEADVFSNDTTVAQLDRRTFFLLRCHPSRPPPPGCPVEGSDCNLWRSKVLGRFRPGSGEGDPFLFLSWPRWAMEKVVQHRHVRLELSARTPVIPFLRSHLLALRFRCQHSLIPFTILACITSLRLVRRFAHISFDF